MIQEVKQGWLAEINRRSPGRDQLRAYAQFAEAVNQEPGLRVENWLD